MFRLLAAIALGLALVACSDRTMGPITGPATGGPPALAAPVLVADPVTKACDDYATGLAVVTPLKATIPPKVSAIIDRANAVGVLACSFGPAGSHYTTAAAAWTAQKGA